MTVNEVTMNGNTIISLVNDTVSEETLLAGETAHDASGKEITGKAMYINPNLIINPDFSINQRGQTEYDLDKRTYAADCWSSMNAETNVKFENGTATIGTIYSKIYYTFGQVIEKLCQGTYTFSVDLLAFEGSVQAIYIRVISLENLVENNNEDIMTAVVSRPASGSFEAERVSATFELTEDIDNIVVYMYGRGEGTTGECFTIARPKLEIGELATPYLPANQALETLKCQRYLQFRTTGDIDPVDLRPTMRITPTITQMEDGRWMYNAEL